MADAGTHSRLVVEGNRMRLHKHFAGSAIAACLLACPLVAEDPGKGVNFYSIEKEIGLGKQMAQEIERQAKIVDDPLVAEYVNRLGQNLAQFRRARAIHGESRRF
jgi:predicted Zn-dependent protease